VRAASGFSDPLLGERHVLTVDLMAGPAQDPRVMGERSEAERLSQASLTRLAEVLG
jgi:hypothetical protein